MTSHSRSQAALANLIEWIGEGRRLSEATASQRKLIKWAERSGHVERNRIRNDYIISATGRPV